MHLLFLILRAIVVVVPALFIPSDAVNGFLSDGALSPSLFFKHEPYRAASRRPMNGWHKLSVSPLATRYLPRLRLVLWHKFMQVAL